MLLPSSVRFDFLLVIFFCGILGIMAQSSSSDRDGLLFSDFTENYIFGGELIAEMLNNSFDFFAGRQNCHHTCTNGGGCHITYVGPPRRGNAKVKTEKIARLHS